MRDIDGLLLSWNRVSDVWGAEDIESQGQPVARRDRQDLVLDVRVEECPEEGVVPFSAFRTPIDRNQFIAVTKQKFAPGMGSREPYQQRTDMVGRFRGVLMRFEVTTSRICPMSDAEQSGSPLRSYLRCKSLTYRV